MAPQTQSAIFPDFLQSSPMVPPDQTETQEPRTYCSVRAPPRPSRPTHLCGGGPCPPCTLRKLQHILSARCKACGTPHTRRSPGRPSRGPPFGRLSQTGELARAEPPQLPGQVGGTHFGQRSPSWRVRGLSQLIPDIVLLWAHTQHPIIQGSLPP